jgi:hypothetical protein
MLASPSLCFDTAQMKQTGSQLPPLTRTKDIKMASLFVLWLEMGGGAVLLS